MTLLNLFEPRVLVWFSCGAASAYAAKIAVDQYAKAGTTPEILYCDTLAYEHPDNRRFMADVEKWIGQPVKLLRSAKFKDIYDVFRREQYLRGPSGAPCTRALKRNVRKEYERPGDIHILGFTTDERHRIDDFELDNPTLICDWVLADQGITKKDCYSALIDAGIELPAMYKLGFNNNNCIGCVKGGAGYWNKIRRHFPGSFRRMAEMEREVGFALLRVKGKPCYLDELPINAGRHVKEPDIECGIQCTSPHPQRSEVPNG